MLTITDVNAHARALVAALPGAWRFDSTDPHTVKAVAAAEQFLTDPQTGADAFAESIAELEDGRTEPVRNIPALND